jgi:hypothetical protein
MSPLAETRGAGIAVIDAATGKRLEDVAKLDAHPNRFKLLRQDR